MSLATVVPQTEVICCPRCENRFKHKVTVVERVQVMVPAARTVEQVLEGFHLSARQFTAAVLLAEGLALREIAARIGTSEAVVKNYVREIYAKTRTRRRQGFRMMIDERRYKA